MGETTGISWADSTFNIAIGCEKCSEGCAYCYAERDMENPKYGSRFKGAWGPERFRYTLSDAYWKKPLTWQRKAAKEGRRIRVFASSLCDVFEQHALIDSQRARLFDLVAQTPNLDWLLLTKRIERAAALWPWKTLEEAPKNVWIGTTVENQARAIQRLPYLLRIPAWLRFISCEPLLGSIDLLYSGFNGADSFGTIPGLHWIIAGGETGKHARITHPEWVRYLWDQAQAAGIPFHFKQWGEWLPYCQMTEAEGQALYKPNVKAKPGEEYRQADLDEAYGSYCTVPNEAIRCDGQTGKFAPGTWELVNGKPAHMCFRVGKKKAGRLLDGVTHDAVPQAA